MTANSETGTPSLTLSLTEQGKGTVLTSTRSVLYGNVTAQMKSVAGSGILTSFALLSGTGDEIDYECVRPSTPRLPHGLTIKDLRFTTNATDVAQTAFFSQGDVDDCASRSRFPRVCSSARPADAPLLFADSSGQALNTSDRAADFHNLCVAHSLLLRARVRLTLARSRSQHDLVDT